MAFYEIEIMERCPLCKARLRAETICNRCEADLSLLQAIESEAERLAALATRNMLAGEIEVASSQASVACDLHATPFHRALSGFIETMDGEESFRQTSSDFVHK